MSNTINKTSFGSLQPLLVKNEEVISELATFVSNGKEHVHDKYEICYVLSGQGKIIQICYGENILNNPITHNVGAGSIVTIPPNTSHWMEVEPNMPPMEIVIIYSEHATKVE